VDDVLPLAEGASGDAVVELRTRLSQLGLSTNPDLAGAFGPATRAAVEAFQYRRGLRVDGACGSQTWNTLVEAGFQLGDRTLWRRSPMLRGDDVAELQQRLGALGFDCGRVDGIFGDNTATGVRDFQHNVGVTVDGIVGPLTVAELVRMQARHRRTEHISNVRAREELRRAPPTLVGRHVAIGEPGGLASTLLSFRRCLIASGALVTAMHHRDDSVQAREANAGEADVLVGLRLDPEALGCTTAYYAGYRTESPGGRRLAELVQARIPPLLGVADGGSRGMSVPLLRETRMPAVIVELGPPAVVAERNGALAGALAGAVEAWARSLWE
jgi:N-acetylmuramoyl-L-alanine amidase